VRQVRERPRLVAARALAVALLVGIAIAIGALLDDPGPNPTPQAESQLKRVRSVSNERADRLDRAGADLQRVQAELDAALARARTQARANSRLRRELKSVERLARRTQGSRRSRSR